MRVDRIGLFSIRKKIQVTHMETKRVKICVNIAGKVAMCIVVWRLIFSRCEMCADRTRTISLCDVEYTIIISDLSDGMDRLTYVVRNVHTAKPLPIATELASSIKNIHLFVCSFWFVVWSKR